MHAETAFIVPDVFGKLCGACIASETVTMWNNWNKKKKKKHKIEKIYRIVTVHWRNYLRDARIEFEASTSNKW